MSFQASDGYAQSTKGLTWNLLLGSIASSVLIFTLQYLGFEFFRNKLARIYKPKTYLVAPRERIEPPGRYFATWVASIYAVPDLDIIKRCGLDAFFFLRYLQTILVILVPTACLVLPILLPINYIGGLSNDTPIVFTNASGIQHITSNVTGVDRLAWGNINTVTDYNRYWAHLILAIIIILWSCFVFWKELRLYTRVRQDYMVSAAHRLRASATTILVSSIPRKWLSEAALLELFDVYPGGVRSIWINRDYGDLADKVKARRKIHKTLEAAETSLIRQAKENQLKELQKLEKKKSKSEKARKLSKGEKAAEEERQEAQAVALASQTDGISVGGARMERTVDDVVALQSKSHNNDAKLPVKLAISGIRGVGQGGLAGLKGVGQGISRGWEAVSKTGEEVIGGGRKLALNLDENMSHNAGFVNLEDSDGPLSTYDDRWNQRDSSIFPKSDPQALSAGLDESALSAQRRRFISHALGTTGPHPRWQIWKAPAGSFYAPLPQAACDQKDADLEKTALKDEDDLSARRSKVEYAISFNDADDAKEATCAAWSAHVKPKDRPTHRLPLFGWLRLPFIGKKVDTIRYCRRELARLNVEIAYDQKHPELYKTLPSAFVQFNHQVAAHMAAQCITHQDPTKMDTRAVEISPNDIIWNNMRIQSLEGNLRLLVITIVVAAMIILWTIPTVFASSLVQIASLQQELPWLTPVINSTIGAALFGVLPALILSLALFLVPFMLRQLAAFAGAQTGKQRELNMQGWYFFFLFVQVFLVVSISSGAITTVLAFTGPQGFGSLTIQSVPNILAQNLPSAANYFFSYMILQAMSASSGSLLQPWTLSTWYLRKKLFDSTARKKWTRNTNINNINWGSRYPVYTNFACITIIYSVVAPLILVFGLITFSLISLSSRYETFYVARQRVDTGGLFYPKAINQTFTGLYFMEIVLIGLFFLVESDGNQKAVPQAIIMIVALIMTAGYQIWLNLKLSPEFNYLPIVLEDMASVRDEAFRQGLSDSDEQETPQSEENTAAVVHGTQNGIELRARVQDLDAEEGGRASSQQAKKGFGILGSNNSRRRNQRQQQIGDALFSGYVDEIEDLSPEQRDALVRRAFTHPAIRARKPVVWIPQDDLGVSVDEIRRTTEAAGEDIWISNHGTVLDHKARVVYGKNPPDFAEVDLIKL